MNARFYVLYVGSATQFYRAKPVTHFTIEQHCEGLHRLGIPIEMKINYGGRPGDLLGTECLQYIISEHLLNVLKENDIKSYALYPVIMTGGKGDLPNYYGLDITGKGGSLNPVKCGIVNFRPDDPKKIRHIKQLVIEEDQWDGSDLFCFDEYPFGACVTERLMKILKKNHVTNCDFTPFEEFTY